MASKKTPKKVEKESWAVIYGNKQNPDSWKEKTMEGTLAEIEKKFGSDRIISVKQLWIYN